MERFSMNGVVNEVWNEATRSGVMLVIGFGNVMRGDDGVGPAVAEAVEALGISGVRVAVHHQLTPELAVPWAGVASVVFVDASMGHESEGVVVRELGFDLTAEGVGWNGHRFTPEALLALALEMNGTRPRAWCVEVPVLEFGWGPGLSAKAQRGVEGAVEAIRALRRAEVCTRQA